MRKLFVITGPSGAGKTTVSQLVVDRANALAEATGNQECGLQRVVTTTTRPPRPGEVDGVDYHFVDRAKFEAMVDAGEFAEHARVYGNLYGTTLVSINTATAVTNAVIVTDVQGATTLQHQPSVVTIFITTTLDALAERMADRNNVAERLATAEQELSGAGECNHVVENIKLAQTVVNVEQVISSYPL